MGEKAIATSLKSARRLAVTKQHLAGHLPNRPGRKQLVDVVRDLAFVQWDPISIVAPSHVLSFWSRVGGFQLSDLDRLLWEEKKLFLTWMPIASIVGLEDFPLHHSLMRRFPDSLSDSWGSQRERARKFLAEHQALHKSLLKQLDAGPLVLSQFHEYVRAGKSADGWTSGNKVSQMLSYLQMTGDVMVVGHQGNQNLWGLADAFLPRSVNRAELTEEEVERLAAQKAIRALGTATARDIHYYFVRGRYRNLGPTLERLETESAIHRVQIQGLGAKELRYVHDGDLHLLESIESDAWQPRLSLLAPFDNLLCGRERTNRLFGFDYVHEQFLPKNKRKYGTYVLPILWGEDIIGRTDLELDKKHAKLLVHSIHAEPGAPSAREVAAQIGQSLERLGDFLGADEVVYTARIPSAWKHMLR